MIKITWLEFFNRLVDVARSIPDQSLVYGVPKGGMIAAGFLHSFTNGNIRLTHNPRDADVIMDDIVDSGRTKAKYVELYPHARFLAVVEKEYESLTDWIEFPWETDHPSGPDSCEQNVVRQLEYIGEDPNREGLLETPKRVIASWSELFAGYKTDPATVLKSFEDHCDEMVVVCDIPFSSMCEHHLLPFEGKAHVGYVPLNRVVGLSKIPRLVDVYARRLQLQERLAREVAQALMTHLRPLGVGVVLEATHGCVVHRGARKPGTKMITSCLLGQFREDPRMRTEFLELVRGRQR